MLDTNQKSFSKLSKDQQELHTLSCLILQLCMYTFLTLTTSQPPNSLPSAAMEGAIQHPPTQATKLSKTKSKSTTLSVSQKSGVVKSTRTKIVWSVKEIGEGEGTGAGQQLEKDNVSKGVQNQPSHSVPTQKGTEVNKKVNTSLLDTSQKVSNIEKRFPTRNTDTRAWTLAKHYHPNQKCLKE